MSSAETVTGRLAKRPYRDGDPLPAIGSKCLVSGVNCDVESDQHRTYQWRMVVGYAGKGEYKFVCLHAEGCWPTVERLENCWFAEIPTPTPPSSNPRVSAERLAELVEESKLRRMTAISYTSEREWLDVHHSLIELTERRAAETFIDHAELLKKIPRVSAEFVAEVRELPRHELEQRVLIQKDWLHSYSQCLDGLGLQVGVESARDPHDIRRAVESAQKASAHNRGVDGFCHTCGSYTCSAVKASAPIYGSLTARDPEDATRTLWTRTGYWLPFENPFPLDRVVRFDLKTGKEIPEENCEHGIPRRFCTAVHEG